MRKNIIFLALLCAIVVMLSGAVFAADVPSANFTSNVTSGTVPLSVQFNDTSAGNVTSWSWDFGDGINSTDENPVHTYTKAGTYSVSLTAGNDAGNNTVIQTNYITVLLNDAYVSTTGSDTTGDGTSTSPYATIQKALNNVVTGGTIHLASGTYTGTGNKAITFTKSVNVVGEDQTSTIIDAANSGNIFTINSGVNVTVANLAFVNGNSTTYGGVIYNKGNTTVSNCTFTGNTAMGSGGIGGGAIYNKGTLNVSNSTFKSNKMATTTSTFAGAIFGDTGTTTSVSNCTFTGNTAVNGGAIWSRGILNVTGSTFTNNTAAGSNSRGGAIFVTAGGVATVHYNSFVNNTAATSGNAIFLGSGTVNAEYNWWGSNNSPSSQVYGNVDYSNWLYMTETVPSTVANGTSANVTVSFNNVWNGTTVTSVDPANGTIPDGTVVNFTSGLGSFSPVTATTVGGIATTNFTATTLGNGTVNATADNQTVSSDVTVNLASSIVAGNVTALSGDMVNLTVTLTDGTGTGLSGENVTFTVNGTSYTATTDSNGLATVTVTAPSTAGVYNVTASFAGDSAYQASSNNGTSHLTVQLRDAYVSPTGSDTSGDGSSSNPYATIQNALNNTVTGGTVHVRSGTYTGTGNGAITISRNVNIVGDNQINTIISAASAGNIFTINSGVNITINNLTLENGNTTYGGAIYNNGTLNVTNSTFTGNYATKYGGVIYTSQGSTTSVSGCTFTSNSAKTMGGVIYTSQGSTTSVSGCTFTGNKANSGGVIYNIGNSVITDCNFTNNKGINAGAIYNKGNVTSLSGCTFTNNTNSTTVTGYGGAVYNAVNITSIVDCTFTGNSMTNAGAIYNTGNITSLSGCTFTNNTASTSVGSGGAILNYGIITSLSGCTFTSNAANFGGAIYNAVNITNVTNCTFTDNSAPSATVAPANNGFGGAIYSIDGTMGVSDCTFRGNSAGTGGAIYNYGTTSNFTVNFSSFLNNTAVYDGNAVYQKGGTFNAKYNWWGSNNSPANQIGISTQIGGTIDYTNWLYMTVTANPSTLLNGSTANVTVSFNNVWNGTDMVSIDPVNGHIPDGAVVSFSSLLGSFAPGSVTTINGTAVTIFTANVIGVGVVNATADNQTVSGSVTVYDVPVAGFSASPTNGTNPLTVQFTDNSSNSPTSWSWNFGDGSTSNEQNPTHTYSKAGNYTVILTVGNVAGNNTVTQANCITVLANTAPVVLNVTPTSGASNLPVNQVITVTFSEPISAGAAYDRIKVITPDNKAKVITKTINGSTLTITANYSYNYGDTYRLVIPVGSVTDLAGNNLTTGYSSNFTIGTVPTVTSVDPVDKAGNVSTTKTITVTFSNNVTAGAAYDKIKVITPSGQAKVISKTLNGNQLMITAAYSYTPGTYTIYIPVGAVESLAGNNLTSNYNSTFTVSSGPNVSNVNTTGLSVNKTITVTFDGNIAAGANFSKIKVITSDNKAKVATVTINGNTLTITAAYNYTPGSYTLSIPANSLTDSNGNAITENYTKTITV